jgi:Holliday junction resolvase
MATLQEILNLPDPLPAPGKRRPLKHYTDSQAGYALRVPRQHHRDVREQVIQREILTHLKERGAFAVKFPAVNLVGSGDKTALASTVKGVPDLLICYKGRFVGIEVKAAKKGVRVSGEQVAQGTAIQKAGGWWLVAYSVEQVEELLNTIDSTL